MNKASQQKVVQYLNEARASEHALMRVLQSQIAMTPRGSYRSLWRRTCADARARGIAWGAAWRRSARALTR